MKVKIIQFFQVRYSPFHKLEKIILLTVILTIEIGALRSIQ